MLAHAEWSIRPSKQQRYRDGIALFLIILLSLPYLWYQWLSQGQTVWLGVGLIVLVVFIVRVWYQSVRDKAIYTLGYRQEKLQRQWWLARAGHRQDIHIRSGSIRRANFIQLRYGHWPWQVLLIRPDSLTSADAFRELKVALYGELA